MATNMAVAATPSSSASSTSAASIASIRATSACCEQGYLRSPFSLTQVRVLYELAQHERHRDRARPPARPGPGLSESASCATSSAGPARAGARRARRPTDPARLSEHGRAAFAPLDARATTRSRRCLSAARERQRGWSRRWRPSSGLRGPAPPGRARPYILRPPPAGRHGLGGAAPWRAVRQEFGFDERVRGAGGRHRGALLRRFDPRASAAGSPSATAQTVGCVFLVKRLEDDRQAAPVPGRAERARTGHRHRPVDECVRFARAAGYRGSACGRRATWSRRADLRAGGIPQIAEEPHHSWSKDLVERDLGAVL